MSRFRSVVIVLLVLVCGPATAPAFAQDGRPFPDFSALPGLESAVSRAHALDFSQIEVAEPGSTPVEFRDALFLAGMVLEFGNAMQAADGYQVMADHGVAPLAVSFGIDAPDIVEVPLTDLGDQAVAFSVFNDTGSTEGYLREVVMQEANYLFIAVILTEAEASSLDADALVTYFSEQVSATPTGLGTIDAEGGSTGGLWSFFPAADHALYAGLIPDGDEVIFPLGGN